MTSVDEAKLPGGKSVAFACPGCSERVVIDRKAQSGGQWKSAPSAPQPVAPVRKGVPAVDVSPTADAPVEAQNHETGAEVHPAPVGERRSAMKASPVLPDGATLPVTAIVAEHRSLAEQLVRVLQPLQQDVRLVDTLDELLEGALPPLLLWAVESVSSPPHEPIQALSTLSTRDRRQMYVVLVASNLSSMDGNAAFFHQVNLVLSSRDLDSVSAMILSGLEYHQRLYRPFLECVEGG